MLLEQQKKENFFHFLRRGDIIKVVDGVDCHEMGKIIDLDNSSKTARISILTKNPQTLKYEESPTLKDFEPEQIEKYF